MSRPSSVSECVQAPCVHTLHWESLNWQPMQVHQTINIAIGQTSQKQKKKREKKTNKI